MKEHSLEHVLLDTSMLSHSDLSSFVPVVDRRRKKKEQQNPVELVFEEIR